MCVLNREYSLLEMEEQLEASLSDEYENNRILGDLELTYEEYKFLLSKVKKLLRYKNEINVIRNYKLCLVTTIVYSMIYERVDHNYIKKMKNMLDMLPQHQIRFFIGILAAALEEAALYTYEQDIRTMDGLLTVFALHAGISKRVHQELFLLVSETYPYANLILKDAIELETKDELGHILHFVDDKTQRRLFNHYVKMFEDLCIKGKSQQEVYIKYPFMSRKLIEFCYTCYKEQQESDIRILEICL